MLCFDAILSLLLLLFQVDRTHFVMISRQVLAITEGVHDVYRLGKEAAALHAVLMSDLSKVVFLSNS